MRRFETETHRGAYLGTFERNWSKLTSAPFRGQPRARKGSRPGFAEKGPVRAYFQEGRIIKKIGFQIWIWEPGLGALGSGAWALGSGGWWFVRFGGKFVRFAGKT